LTIDEFARKKVAEALRAPIPGFATAFDRAPGDMQPIGNEWTRRLFDGPFHLTPVPPSGLPACSLVFVQSRSGNTGARDPGALGGGATDKHLIYEGLSRVAADAVLAGAETIRGGQLVFSVWHPELEILRHALGKPRHPAQIVATLRGLPIEGSLFFNVPEIPVFVLTTASWAAEMQREFAARPWITPIVMNGPDGMRGAFEELRARGINRISCVGGRTLATHLIDLALVQDVYLTTSPQEGGEPGTPMYPRELPGEVIVRKYGRAEEGGVVFEHWRM
jgi:riboflavin biosynthesis pyrimidine reductase